MLNWTDLKFFFAVAEHGTISAAAEALRVNHTTVSRRISVLEDTHQMKLFDRSNSGYTLTAAGVALAAKSDVVRDAMGEAERAIAASEALGVGPLVVTAPTALVLHVLGPIVSRFSKANPGIEVRLQSEDRLVSLPRREADVAIRATNTPEEHLVGRKLASFVSTFFAAETVLSEVGNKPVPWIQIDGDAAQQSVKIDSKLFQEAPRCTVSGKSEGMALAEAGIGAVLIPYRLGDASKVLRRVPGSPIHRGKDIWLLYHRDLRSNPRVRVFSEFLFDQFKLQQAAFEGRIMHEE
jgi:DNA-binding transcriptional LysR family regulator